MIPLALSLIVLLICAFVVAWPQKSKGCMAEFVRPLAGLAGAVIPLGLVWVWEKPSGLVDYGAMVAAFVLNISAVALAATGWQSILRGRRGEVEEAMADGLLNPFSALSQPAGSSTSSDDVLGGCVLAVMLMVINVFIIGGLLIANVLKKLLPAPGGPWRRAARVGLSLVYTLVVYGGGAALLLSTLLR